MEVLQNEIEEAKPNGQVDEVFKKYVPIRYLFFNTYYSYSMPVEQKEDFYPKMFFCSNYLNTLPTFT